MEESGLVLLMVQMSQGIRNGLLGKCEEWRRSSWRGVWGTWSVGMLACVLYAEKCAMWLRGFEDGRLAGEVEWSDEW